MCYSFTDEPREVLHGGYLSWLDPMTNSWWQARDAGQSYRQARRAATTSKENGR